MIYTKTTFLITIKYNLTTINPSTMDSTSGVNNDQGNLVHSPNGLNLIVARNTKADKSSKFFKATRVDSCSHVIVKNGVAEAIPFRPAAQKDDGPKQHYSTSLSQ
jgi:hypothetical protein